MIHLGEWEKPMETKKNLGADEEKSLCRRAEKPMGNFRGSHVDCLQSETTVTIH